MQEENTYNTGFEGLKNLSKTVHVNPFVVPSDFFEEQENKVKDLIKLEHNVPKSILKGFIVPDSYFENLERSIKSEIAICQAEENLKSSFQSQGFSTPDDYFNEFENQLFTRIKEHSLKATVNKDGFTVPEGYFDRLSEKIKDQVEKSTIKQPVIVSLKKKRLYWTKFSAAAIIILIGVGTVLSYFQLENSFMILPKTTVHSTINLNKISDDELLNYLTQVADNVDELMTLTKIIENKTGQLLHLESEMNRDEEIQEYLKYML